jgi:long-chain acyl-CoA synthetase
MGNEFLAGIEGDILLVKDILDHHNKVNPNKLAIISSQQNLTYREFFARVQRVSNVLTDKLGLVKGDRFAILSQNNGYIPELYFAAALTGVVAVPINYRLTLFEICSIMKDAEAMAIFVDSDHAEGLEEIEKAAGIGHGIVLETEENVLFGLSYESLVHEASDKYENNTIIESNIVLQIYTSGTTGTPKGVMISNRNIMANSWTSVVEGNIRQHDRFLNVAPMCHLSAGSRVFSLAFAGATHVILQKFDPETVFQIMGKHRITHALLVPTMISSLLESEKFDANLFSHLEMITYGAAPMPIPLLQKAMDAFQCKFWNGYGLTEASPMLTGLKPNDHQLALYDSSYEKILNSVGKQLLGISLRVVNDEGNEVNPGETGEIIAKGKNVMEGYWKNPESTKETIKDGWLYTGDIGMIDENGYVYIVDRKKDMMISGGLNVYPREIEKVMEQYTGVKEVAVTSIADVKWGEVPIAFVVSEENLSTEKLQDWLTERLAKFKLPKKIVLVDELPRNTTGKIQKHALKTKYLAHN